MSRSEPGTRTIVIDDERLARAELRRLLQGHPSIEVVAEAASVAEAAERVEALEPDLLFLDIQLPDGRGFDLLEGLHRVPSVIFTTAFDQYALRAFEINALDYLLKPVDPARLASALDRLEPRARATKGRRLGASDRVFVRAGERCWFVSLAEIVLLESDGHKTRIQLRGVQGDEPVQTARSLAVIEERLDSSLFFRANRRQLIHTRWIVDVDPGIDGRMVVRLEGGTLVTLSRRQALEFRRRMEL